MKEHRCDVVCLKCLKYTSFMGAVEIIASVPQPRIGLMLQSAPLIMTFPKEELVCACQIHDITIQRI